MTQTETHEFRTVLEDQRSALIHAEMLAGEQRAQFEKAVHEMVNRYGHTVDAVSEASGLTPAEVRRIASTPRDMSLADLAGVA